jgi:hypothetical protein
MITFLSIVLILSIISIYFAFTDDKVDEKYTDFGTKERFDEGYYDENNKYYDSYNSYLNQRRWEREERERTRYQSDYESWKRKQSERENKSETNSKVDKIFDLLVKDFSNNPYHDKLISLGSSYDIISFTYKFENGFKFTLNDKEIRIYNRNGENISSYRLGDLYHLKFLKLILEMKEKSQHRFKDNFNSKYNDYKREQPKEEPKVKSTGNIRLDKINEKILLREEQLRKMKNNDPERPALENELNTYKNIAKKIKSKIK